MKHKILLIGILALSILFPFTVQAKPVGKITYIKGRVDITSPGKATRPVKRRDEVYAVDIIRTKSGSKAEIAFIDGNILRLAQKTRMKITEYVVKQDQTRVILKLFRGEIRSKVKKFGRIFGFRRRDRYEVQTPTAVCGIKGTDFFVYYKRWISGAAFKEGSGYGYSINKPNEVKLIEVGEAIVVTISDQAPMVRKATDIEFKKHEKDTTLSAKEKEEEEKEKADDEIAPAEGLTEITLLDMEVVDIEESLDPRDVFSKLLYRYNLIVSGTINSEEIR